MQLISIAGLFCLTAVAEIVGCYLPYLYLKQNQSAWLLLPAALSLALFVWLLTLQPFAAARTYAAYGGVYVVIAMLWLWLIQGQQPSHTDIIGALVAISGMMIIVLGAQNN